MCGSIVGALTLNLSEKTRAKRYLLLAYVLTYNFGRISSYAVAGGLMGTAGQALFEFISPNYGHTVLKVMASLIIIGMGMYLANWFPRFASIERIGIPLWNMVEPVGRSLIPPPSIFHAFLLGAIWGWLPCGLVYSTLLLTASSGNAAEGAIFMLSFGVGTLPAMLGTGIIAGLIMRISRLPYLRHALGVTIIILGILSFFYTGTEPHLITSP